MTTFISPAKVSPDNHKALLDLLGLPFNEEYSKIERNIGIRIPVPPGVDVSTILKQIEETAPLKMQTKDGKDVEIAEEAEEDIDPPNLVDHTAVQPRNRQEQLATVLITKMPNLKKKYINRLIDALLGQKLKLSYIWATTGAAHDTLGVYVRFASVVATEWLHRNQEIITQYLPGVSMVFAHGLEPTGEVILEPEQETMKAEFARILGDKRNHSTARKTGTEDLDQVAKYYESYKVENSDLVEVPADMKDVIVKDIIRFRSHVLAVERERRKRELEAERRKARLRLNQIFRDMRLTKVDNDDVEMEADDNEPQDDEFSDMNDEEYEKHLRSQESKRLDQLYEAKVQSMHTKERTMKNQLLEDLDVVLNYEKNLPAIKVSLIDDLRSFRETEALENPNLSSKMHLYYNDHWAYLRLRNEERLREEEEDKKDELLEELSGIKILLKAQIPDEKLEASAVEVSKLNLTQLELMKSKIGNLVEEYLGIQEPVLISFIYDFIIEHGMGDTDTLVSELAETLDDDADAVVKELYEFIGKIGNDTA